MRPDKKKKPYKGKGYHQTTEKSSESQDTPQKEKQVQNPATTSQEDPHLEEESKQELQEETVDLKQESTEKENKKTFSKRQVFSNWERYTEPVRDDQEQRDDEDGVDFSKLLHLPSSGDGHFKFKSEKIEPPSSGSLFALDLKMLTEKLRTIPFYKQLDLPESYFSPAEITAMEMEAKKQVTFQSNAAPDLLSLIINKPETCNISPSLHTSDETHTTLVSELPSSKVVQTEVNAVPPINKYVETESFTTSQCSSQSKAAPVTETLKSTEAPKEQREKKPRKSDPPNASSQAKLNEDLEQLNSLLENNVTLSGACVSAPKLDEKSDSAPNENESPTQTNVTKSKEDLESWLDSVLDD